MAPAATSSAAPAIPNKDRRGSDVPFLLPIPVTTCSRDCGFKGLYNGTDAAWAFCKCVDVALLMVILAFVTRAGEGPHRRGDGDARAQVGGGYRRTGPGLQ